jgi:thiazole/oxazole-forming peptide maturase SagD family component
VNEPARLRASAWAQGTKDRALLCGDDGSLHAVDGEHVPLLRGALELARAGTLDEETLAERVHIDADDALELIALLEDTGMLEPGALAPAAPPSADTHVASVLDPQLGPRRGPQLTASASRTLAIDDAGGVWVHAALARDAACATCLQLRLLARAPAALAELAFSLTDEEASTSWAVARAAPTPPALVQRQGSWVAWGAHGAASSHETLLLPHPACPRCGARAAVTPMRVSDDAQPARPDARAAALDARLGPFLIAHSEAGGARITTGGYAIAWPTRRLDTGAFGAMGLGDDEPMRDLVCLSECCERYALRTVAPEVEEQPYAALRERAVDPRRFTLYSPEQSTRPGFRYPAFHDALPLHWVTMTRAQTGDTQLVPIELVGNQLDPVRIRTRLLDNVGSTGAASHESLARAGVSALREILERDAACMMWMTRSAPPRIDLTSAARHDAVGARIERAAAAGLTLRAYAVPTDANVPVVFVAATREKSRGNWERGGVVAACSAGLTPTEALAHALDELHAHTITLCDMPGPSKDWRNHPYDPRAPDQGFDHWWPLYLHYLNPAHAAAFGFLDATDAHVSLEALPRLKVTSPTEAWASLVARAEQAGIEVWGRDITPPDVHALGFCVVKLVGAGALDIACGLQSLRLGSARLTRALAGRAPNADPPPII